MNHAGQAAPFSIHSRIFCTNSAWLNGGMLGPSPGVQPQNTSGSASRCSMAASRLLPPFCCGSFHCQQKSPADLPSNTMLGMMCVSTTTVDGRLAAGVRPLVSMNGRTVHVPLRMRRIPPHGAEVLSTMDQEAFERMVAWATQQQATVQLRKPWRIYREEFNYML